MPKKEEYPLNEIFYRYFSNSRKRFRLLGQENMRNNIKRTSKDKRRTITFS